MGNPSPIKHKTTNSGLKIYLYRRKVPTVDNIKHFMDSYIKVKDYTTVLKILDNEKDRDKYLDPQSAIDYWKLRAKKLSKGLMRETNLDGQISRVYKKVHREYDTKTKKLVLWHKISDSKFQKNWVDRGTGARNDNLVSTLFGINATCKAFETVHNEFEDEMQLDEFSSVSADETRDQYAVSRMPPERYGQKIFVDGVEHEASPIHMGIEYTPVPGYASNTEYSIYTSLSYLTDKYRYIFLYEDPAQPRYRFTSRLYYEYRVREYRTNEMYDESSDITRLRKSQFDTGTIYDHWYIDDPQQKESFNLAKRLISRNPPECDYREVFDWDHPSQIPLCCFPEYYDPENYKLKGPATTVSLKLDLTDADVEAMPDFQEWKETKYRPYKRPENTQFIFGKLKYGNPKVPLDYINVKSAVAYIWNNFHPRKKFQHRELPHVVDHVKLERLDYTNFRTPTQLKPGNTKVKYVAMWRPGYEHIPDPETKREKPEFNPLKEFIREQTEAEKRAKIETVKPEEYEELRKWYFCENFQEYARYDLDAIIGKPIDNTKRITAIVTASSYAQQMSGFPDGVQEHEIDNYDIVDVLLGKDTKITLTYSEQNSVGNLTFTIPRNTDTNSKAIQPTVGDIIFFEFDGKILFRGNVYEIEATASETEVRCENVFGMLNNKSIISIGNYPGILAIYSICESAGAIVWRHDKVDELDSSKRYSAYYSNQSYLDALRDMTDRIAVEEGKNLVLLDDNGTIMMTTAETLQTNHVITPENAQSWSLKQSINESTFNRILLTVKPQVSEGQSFNTNSGKPDGWKADDITGQIHLASVNPYLSIMYGKFLSYSAQANTVMEGTVLEKWLSDIMYTPTYTLSIKGYRGKNDNRSELYHLSRLQPGYSVLLDFDQFISNRQELRTDKVKGNKGIRALISSITHSWISGAYSIDFECTLDPNLDTGDRTTWSHEMQLIESSFIPGSGIVQNQNYLDYSYPDTMYEWTNEYVLKSPEKSN
jgi:hypothetical protein